MKKLISVLAGALIVMASIGFAAPAHAAVYPSIVTWTQVGTTCSASASVIRANPGSRFTLHNGLGGTYAFLVATPTSIGSGTYSDYQLGIGPGGDATFTAPPTVGTYEAGPVGACPQATLIVTNDVIETPAAHDYFQHVGVPASGSCADVPPWVGHWPGFPIGGWSKSWAQWIYDGRGGPVCVREVETRPNGSVVLIG